MVFLKLLGVVCIISLFTEGYVCFLTSPASSSFLCRYISKFNCTEFSTGTLCGTNGITYGNHCSFSKSLCSHKNLKIRHSGPCKTEKEEQELVLSLACMDLLNMDCQSFTGTTSYCGTDGNTYSNVCHFEKARCTSHNLYLNHIGNC